MLSHFFASEAARGIVKGARGFGVIESAYAARGEPVEKWGDNDLQIRTPRTGNNADGVKGGGWLHASAILPQGFARVQKILLVAFGAGQAAGANGEYVECEMRGSFANGGDGFFVESWGGDDAAGADVFAG